MRAWATKQEPTERLVPFAQRLHVVQREPEPEDDTEEALDAADVEAPLAAAEAPEARVDETVHDLLPGKVAHLVQRLPLRRDAGV